MKHTISLMLILASNIFFAQFGNRIMLETSLTGGVISEITTGDLNNDRFQDIIVSRTITGQIDYYINQGNGTFGAGQILISLPHSPFTSVTTGDFNNDGWDDIATATMDMSSQTDTLFVLLNNNGSTFTKIPVDVENNVFEKVFNVKTADMDNDGDLDLVGLADINLYVYFNDGSGNFTKIPVSLGNNPGEFYDLQLADINNDGFTDVLIGGVNPVRIYMNTNGTLHFDASRTNSITNQGLVFMVEPGDFDNDGDLDILISGNNQTDLRWYANDGNGFFSMPHIFQTNISSCESASVMDFDLDGDADVFTVFPQTGEVVWYENAGNGVLNSRHVITTGPVPHAKTVYSDDLNNDGKPDIIWAQELSVHLNVTTINIHDNRFENAFDIYPNPVRNGTLYISSGLDAGFSIYDNSGKLIFKDFKLYTGHNIFRINLPPGLYFIEFKHNNQVTMKKFSVEK